MSCRKDSIWLSTEGFLGTGGFRVVRLWGVVLAVLVVPDAVVCASPADSAETSASVASVFSWIFIWPLFAVKSRCRKSQVQAHAREPQFDGEPKRSGALFAALRFAVACEHLKNLP